MRSLHTVFQVFFMRLIRARQSEAQFFQTELQEFQGLVTHDNSVAIHNEFLLSLQAMPLIHAYHTAPDAGCKEPCSII